MVKLVKMVRGAEYPEPRTADVHPDELDNYRIGGFEIADPLDHDGDGVKGGSLPRRSRKKVDG